MTMVEIDRRRAVLGAAREALRTAIREARSEFVQRMASATVSEAEASVLVALGQWWAQDCQEA